jgi:glycosyltransferase involved in cell wall biosynthesis
MRSRAAARRRTRLEAAKVVRVSLDEPLRPLEVESRYREVLLVVSSRGELLGRVWLPALSVVPVDLQQAAIAAELGSQLWQQELRQTLERLPLDGVEDPRPVRRALGVSVVVCTHDRPDHLRRCLESLSALTREPLEIVVVDSAPSDDRAAAVCREFPVRYVHEHLRGTSRARNRGIREAAGELIAFTDDDCIVDPHWLDDIERDFADPLVMAVSGPIEPLELETRAQYLFEAHGAFARITEPIVFDGLSTNPVVAPYLAVATANVVFRRRVFDEIGTFPEDFGAATPIETGEDPYVFYRLLAAGYRISANPARFVSHGHRREYDVLRRTFFSYSLALFAHTLRCVVRHRELAAMRIWTYWWFNHLPREVLQALRRDDPRIPARLLLTEISGALHAPWRLLRTTLRRGEEPLELPPVAERPATPQVRGEAPDVSLVIPSHNRRDGLVEMLNALREQRFPPERFEVVAVLDGSADGSAEAARSLELPYALRVVEQENAGAATARNRGVAEARQPVVVCIDDDMLPDPSFLVAHANAHSRSVREQIVLGHCPPAIASDDLWALTLRNWWSDHFRRKSEPDHRWTFVDLTIGNFSISRDLYRDLGGLDEEFRRREDWEFAVRLLDGGIGFRYEPAATAWHHVEPSFAKRLRETRQEARDDVRLARKHPRVREQLKLAEVARLMAAESSARLAYAYGHPRASARATRLAPPLLATFQFLRLRAQWRRLAALLTTQAYVAGVSDVFPSPRDFLSFYAPSWSERAHTLRVELDGVQTAVPLPPAGPVELELDLGKRAVARVPILELERQWEWREVREVLLHQSSYAILTEVVRSELDEATAFEEALHELEERLVRAD